MSFLIDFIILSVAFILYITPLKVRWWGACFLAWLWFDVIRLRRFTVLKNLTIAFPEMPADEKYRIARESMRCLCLHPFEVFLLPMLSEAYAKKNVIVEGIENYEKAIAKGKGVYLLSWHHGNGDFAIAMLGFLKFPVHIITKKFKNKTANDVWFSIRRKVNMKTIDPHGTRTPFEVLKAIGKNECVIFVLDQFMGKPYGIENTFFGRKTGTAYGLALFAIKTGSPVVPLYTYRDESHRTHLVFLEEIPLEKIEDRDLQIKTMTQKYTDKIEEIVRKKPEQWMWVHRRWKVWG